MQRTCGPTGLNQLTPCYRTSFLETNLRTPKLGRYAAFKNTFVQILDLYKSTFVKMIYEL